MNTGNLVWLDLCSGLGGASQPAKDRGWRVVRVDIEPRFEPDILSDIRVLSPTDLPGFPTVLWASPPCQQYSLHGMKCFFPNPPEPDHSIALKVRELIKYLAPSWWIVENVWAARPWFTRFFGPVRALIPGHAFWSNAPILLPNVRAHKQIPERKRKAGRQGGVNAMIPYEIGEAICRAVETKHDIR